MLRVLPHGHKRAQTSLIDFQQIPEQVLAPDRIHQQTELYLYVDNRHRLAYPKPRDTFRVFAFGGSTTMGLGFPHNGSFARWLERMLAASYPGRKVEVVNMGRVGYATDQDKELVREVLEKGEPDLLVELTGHNEFLDLKSRGALMRRGVASKMFDLSVWLDRHVAVAQFIRDRMPLGRRKPLIDPRMLIAFHDIVLDAEQMNFGYHRFEKNLTTMIRAAKARGVPFVLCTLLSDASFWAEEDAFQGHDWQQEQNPHLFYQAIGWARLSRWDKAEEALRGLTRPSPRYGLIRIYEAAGVRAIDRLSPETRRSLVPVAREVIREVDAITDRRFNDLFALALAYRLLDDQAGLADARRQMEARIEMTQDPQGQRCQRIVLAQFGDAEAFYRAHYDFWLADHELTCAPPRMNEIIRGVAAREGASLADIEKTLSDWRDPTPSHYLLDYCHFNIDGAFEAARIIFETARQNRFLPPQPREVDFRAALFEPDLAFLRRAAHDFVERDRYLGLDFRVCCVYSQTVTNPNIAAGWLNADAAREPDQNLVNAFRQNRRWFQSP